MNRASHAIMGTNIRCGWGCLHRRGEDRRCTASFHSYSDPEVITSQLEAADWTRRRVRVPKAHQGELGARVVQYLCPEHSRHVAKLRDERAQQRAAKAAAKIDPDLAPLADAMQTAGATA